MTAERLEELIALAEAAAPGDDAAALVLADHLSALGDPRGELIVLDALDRAGRLDRPEQLERLLILAAEYTFPHREPERPPLRWERANTGEAKLFRVYADAAVFTFDFYDFGLSFSIEGPTTMPIHDEDTLAQLLAHDELTVEDNQIVELKLAEQDDGEGWSEADAAACMPSLCDWIRYRIPIRRLCLPLESTGDEPAPQYDGGPPRIAWLPTRYREPRRIPYGRYALAGRDYVRWHSTYRRLEAMLPR